MQPLPPLVPGDLADADFLRLIGRPDPVILDIGCNDGAEIDRFLKMFPKCQVHAFEPDPRPRARFKKHIRDKRVKLWPLAISAEDDAFGTAARARGLSPARLSIAARQEARGE